MPLDDKKNKDESAQELLTNEDLAAPEPPADRSNSSESPNQDPRQ